MGALCCGGSIEEGYKQDLKSDSLQPAVVDNRELQPKSSGWTRNKEPKRVQPSLEDKRRAQLEAAEKRIAANDSRGLGDSSRAATLSEYGAKQELIGRITEVCRVRGIDAPMGLGLLSLDQLKDTYAKLKVVSK